MSFEWSSLIQPAIQLFRLKGKVVLNRKLLVIHYMAESNSTAIDGFTIFLQFLNRRRDQIIISDFTARFYDGKNYHNMYVAGNTIPPAISITPKSPSDIKIMLNISEELMDVPFAAINKKIAHVDLRYKVNEKSMIAIIDEIETEGPDNPYSWVAF